MGSDSDNSYFFLVILCHSLNLSPIDQALPRSSSSDETVLTLLFLLVKLTETFLHIIWLFCTLAFL